jgi:uncharacterized protein (DUF1697 family)
MHELHGYIALLRAINVGGQRVKMAQLRSLFEALGFANVQTFIASGNLFFATSQTDAATLERQIESHLKHALGYEVATYIRTPAELLTIAEYQPFPERDGGGLYIAFLPRQPDSAASERLLALQTPIDDLLVHGREIYWHCRATFSESTLSGALLEKTLGMPMTLRNSTTVRKLAGRYAPTR